MVRVTGFYTWRDGATFDHEYYAGPHMALTREQLAPHGLRRLESDRFLVSPPKPGDLIAASHAYFDTLPAAHVLRAAGKILLADAPKYTNLTPDMKVSVVTSHV